VPATTPAALTPATYQRLRDDLAEILETSRDRAREAVAAQAVAAYWAIGKRIAHERLTTRAGYGDAILRRLATDLDIHLRTLQRASAFYRAFPRGAPRGVGWSHARELARLKDPEARAELAALVVENGLTRRQLAAAVVDYLDPDEPAPKPARAPKLTRPKESSFLYRAEVQKIVDGDTLDLRLDLGFDVDKRHRVRLADVDTAAAGTETGERARRYVEDVLANASSIAIQTRKFDLHGRYVAHLFYAKAEPSNDKARVINQVFAKGRWLNQDLLDQDLALPWKRAGRRKP
jgi:endonuclease YncB( thermonuclease family)